MEVVRKVLGLLPGRRKKRRAYARVVECLEPHSLFHCIEQAKTGAALLLAPRGRLPIPSLLYAAREVPVVVTENHEEALTLLEILCPPLGAGLYEARARLIRTGRSGAEARGELELAVSSLAEEWPVIVAVHPPEWQELGVAGVIEVHAEGVCGVLALRRVV
jgi:hypothetical protein